MLVFSGSKPLLARYARYYIGEPNKGTQRCEDGPWGRISPPLEANTMAAFFSPCSLTALGGEGRAANDSEPFK